jgi:hypothetical protein
MSAEAWARVSLRISSPHLGVDQIGVLMAGESSAKPGHSWTTDLTVDSSTSLNEQLEMAREYIKSKTTALEQLVDQDACLSIGWTPRTPQDGIILDRELLSLLAKFRIYVLLDTYVE